jgi:multidrug efflux pump subunit AcrA (membrane-fusion protein)
MGRRSGQIAPRWMVFATVVVAALAVGGYLLVQYLRPMVDATAVVEGPVVEAFYATGTVSAEREYSVRSPAAGIVRVNADKGSLVKKGEVLAVVENSSLKFAVDQDQAELHRKQLLADTEKSPILQELRDKIQASNDMLDIAMRDEKRVTGLMGQGATSQTDLDTSMNRVKTMWSETESYKSQLNAKKIDLDKDVDVARAALDSAQWELDQATIHSPIDGTVLDWPISTGTRVAVNDHVLQLADVTADHLVMRAQVDEEDKNKLRPPTPDGNRQPVKMTLYAYPGEVLTGTLDKIYDKADPDRRTYEVEVKFDKPDRRLAAGMTGELNFIVSQKASALIVPTQAVQGGMVTVIRDGKLERPQITTGLKSIERTEIQSGLAKGDVIVISPTLTLEPGQSVRMHWIDPLVAAALNTPKESASAFKGFN